MKTKQNQSLVKKFIEDFSEIVFEDKNTKNKYVFEIQTLENKKNYRFSVSSNSIYFMYFCKSIDINLIIRLSDHYQAYKYQETFLDSFLIKNKKLFIQINMFFWNFDDWRRNRKAKFEKELIKKLQIQLINLNTILNYRFSKVNRIYERHQKNINNFLGFLKDSTLANNTVNGNR